MISKEYYGSELLHVIIFCCTFGVGNVIYYFIAWNNAERVMLYIEDKA